MVSLGASMTLNYFRPHRNQYVFIIENASYTFTAVAYISATILLQPDIIERKSIGTFLIMTDVLLLVMASIAILYSVKGLLRSIRDADLRREYGRNKMLEAEEDEDEDQEEEEDEVEEDEENAGKEAASLLPPRPPPRPQRQNSDVNTAEIIEDEFRKSELGLKQENEARRKAQQRRVAERLDARMLLHRTRALQKCPVFDGISGGAARSVLDAMRFRVYKSADVICREGTTANEFFVIVRGEAQVSIKHASEHGVAEETEIVKSLHKLDFFGESALKLMNLGPDASGVPKLTRNATITALKLTQCMVLTRKKMKKLIDAQKLPEGVLRRALSTGRRRSTSLARRRTRRKSEIDEHMARMAATKVHPALPGTLQDLEAAAGPLQRSSDDARRLF